jgi:protein involved in polysaccharide export with SLBB domain
MHSFSDTSGTNQTATMRYCLKGARWNVERLLLVASLLVGLHAPPVYAQVTPSASAPSEDAVVYRFAGPGQATETIYVLGAVEKSGIWNVEPTTGLVELFSLVRPSGYGVQGAQTSQEVRIRIYRSTNGASRVALDETLSDILAMGPNRRPSLEGGDVVDVTVVEDRTFSIGTLSTVVGTLSSLVLLGLRLFDR